MAAPRRRWLTGITVALAVAVGTGCNLLQVPYYLLGPESRREAELKSLASEDSDKEVRVVILTYTSLETRPELLRVDRELTGLLTHWLDEGFKYNKEKVTIFPVRQIERFKDETPGWRTLDPQDIGKKFGADYVISLEIDKISLYEPGSGNQLYRGRIEVSVSLTDMSRPDDDPITKPFTCEYPSEAKGPIPAGESNPLEFRKAFANYVAKRLSWYFTSHPMNKEYSCE